MNQIKINDGIVTITFNKQLYKIEAIKQSLIDFKEVCNSKLDINDRIIVKLSSKKDSLTNILGLEFYNYVLGIMKNENLI